MDEVTRILEAAQQGDPKAAEAMRRILIDRARKRAVHQSTGLAALDPEG